MPWTFVPFLVPVGPAVLDSWLESYDVLKGFFEDSKVHTVKVHPYWMPSPSVLRAEVLPMT